LQPKNGAMRKRQILVVEDEYLIAADLMITLEEAGFAVVGPAGSIEDALQLLERDDIEPDAAVLDINLRGKRVFPVADALSTRGI
jgi:DNA-binding response OmpR family regulator